VVQLELLDPLGPRELLDLSDTRGNLVTAGLQVRPVPRGLQVVQVPRERRVLLEVWDPVERRDHWDLLAMLEPPAPWERQDQPGPQVLRRAVWWAVDSRGSPV